MRKTRFSPADGRKGPGVATVHGGRGADGRAGQEVSEPGDQVAPPPRKAREYNG